MEKELNVTTENEKKIYSAPTIAKLGSAVELTKGGGSNGGDLHGSKPVDLGL